MEFIRFRKWELECDREATRHAYKSIERGAEGCSEDKCQNFAAARLHAYPQEALELFETLGIDFRREAETYYVARVTPDLVRAWREQGRPVSETVLGLHFYEGWFHFVGGVRSGPDSFVPIPGTNGGTIELEPLTDRFSIGFTGNRGAVVQAPFRGSPLVELDFEACIPWVLQKPEPLG